MSKKLASIALAAMAALSLSSCIETERDPDYYRYLEEENERLQWQLAEAECRQRKAEARPGSFTDIAGC